MSEVQSRPVRVFTEQVIYVEVSGAPDIKPYSHGMPLRPKGLRVYYQNGRRGAVTLHGPRVTATGKERKDSVSSVIVYEDRGPDWLRPILAQLDEVYARDYQLVGVPELVVGDVVLPWNPEEAEVFGVDIVTSPPRKVPRQSFGVMADCDWVVDTDRGQISRRAGDDSQRVKIRRRA